jgi:hypothetical protein
VLALSSIAWGPRGYPAWQIFEREHEEDLEACRIRHRHEQIDARSVLRADRSVQVDVFANELGGDLGPGADGSPARPWPIDTAEASLIGEPEGVSCDQAIADTIEWRVSAVNFVESTIVIDASRDPIASRRFDDFITEANIFIEPVTEIQAQIARNGYRDFGKGSGHPQS